MIVTFSPRFWPWLDLPAPLWFVVCSGGLCTYYRRHGSGTRAA